MTQEKNPPRARLRRGCTGSARVAVPLTEQERADLEEISIKESRTASNMARLIYLRGLEAFKSEQPVQ
ncbi:hypothetical protein [Klebsiella variicola]|uniref:hypothetical protein n=1 Tax=Klebsiella variicola TaxID=244366 RepID=UPI002FE262D0|nr:hypothetical protein [Klebsiella variicola]